MKSLSDYSMIILIKLISSSFCIMYQYEYASNEPNRLYYIISTVLSTLEMRIYIVQTLIELSGLHHISPIICLFFFFHLFFVQRWWSQVTHDMNRNVYIFVIIRMNEYWSRQLTPSPFLNNYWKYLMYTSPYLQDLFCVTLTLLPSHSEIHALNHMWSV